MSVIIAGQSYIAALLGGVLPTTTAAPTTTAEATTTASPTTTAEATTTAAATTTVDTSTFTDTLARADESPVGSPYLHIAQEGGELNLLSGVLRQDYDSGHTAYAQGEARYTSEMASANGHLEFDYDMSNASVTNNNVGCYGRLNDYDAILGVAGMNCYWFRTYGSTDSAHRQILRCQGATIDLLAQDTGGSVSGTFVAEWNGTSLSLDDGVGGSPLTTTDSTITDGKYWGLFAHINGTGSGYVEILPNIAYTTPA